MTVAILVPVLRRPQNVAPLVENVRATTPMPYRLLFIVDPDDFEELDALAHADADFVLCDAPGTYARKINVGARVSTERLLFSAADDVRFHPGWFEAATAKLDGTVQVVGTNDLGNSRTIRGEHSTHTLFTRAYIDDPGGVIDGPPGQVLCELYRHDHCDDEFIQTAQHRGVYAHAPDSHVEHLHYLWGKGVMDSTYEEGRKHSRSGAAIFRRRRRLWR